jgi:hypothetical protein
LRHWGRFALWLGTCLIVTGCAQRAPVVMASAEQQSQARERFSQRALADWTAMEIRLARVTHQVAVGAVSMCPNTESAFALWVQHIGDLPYRLRGEVRDAFASSPSARVFALDAQALGLREDERIVAVGGVRLDDTGSLQALDEALGGSRVTLRLRGAAGIERDLAIDAQRRCKGWVVLDARGEPWAAYRGWRIEVSAGLLGLLDDDALAFVVAHELGHQHLGHLQELMVRAAAGAAVDVAAGQTGLFSLGAMLTGRQALEREADRFALEAVHRAGFDLDGAGQVFDVMARHMPQTIGKHWMGQHPRLADRHADMMALKGHLLGDPKRTAP